MSNIIDVTRNPRFQPDKQRPVKYFGSQIKDLFRNAAPNMTPEQSEILSKLNASLVEANKHMLQKKKEEAAETMQTSKAAKERVMETCKQIVDDFMSDMNLGEGPSASADELIILKHQILQQERDLERLKKELKLEFLEVSKRELRTMTEETNLRLKHKIEIEHLKTELVCLELDVEKKRIIATESRNEGEDVKEFKEMEIPLD